MADLASCNNGNDALKNSNLLKTKKQKKNKK